MKLLSKIFCISCLLTAVASCSKEDDLDIAPPVGLGGASWAEGPIDIWLKDSLTTPYNIAVKYHWDPWEVALNRNLTPPDESRIIEAMSAIKRVWIDPYNEETGNELFIKQYSPKQFVLVGSVQYDFGTVLLGQAEGGNNIVFYDINQNFDDNSARSLQRMIRTSHHEFAHILHQHVRYPEEFKVIGSNLSLPGYTATWFNTSGEEALNWGYITPYSMASYDEDFVEMVANMLMLGRNRFNELVGSANATAAQALRQKEQIVVAYFKQVYKIDFYSLQTRVQAALNNLAAVATVPETFGFGKEYTMASVDPSNPALLPQSSAAINLFNTIANNVAAIPGFGLRLDSMVLMETAMDAATLRLYIHQADNIRKNADFAYTLTKDGNNVYDFSYLGTSGNGTIIEAAVTPLLDYFSNNQFQLSWHADLSTSIFARVRFTPQGSPNAYFTALLLP